ncbi:hypothetical protein KM043_010486 [Ampulex compressa]|nr:hypothetical protein KM043_010486 [Ampulex compressa]
MKQYLKQQASVIKDGHACIIAECPICDTGKERGPKVYINKTTGFFVCDGCRCYGSWDILERFLQQQKSDDMFKELSLIKRNLAIIESFDEKWNEMRKNEQSISDLSETFYEEILRKFSLPIVSQEDMGHLDCIYENNSETLHFPLIAFGKCIVGYKSLSVNSEMDKTIPVSNVSGIIIYKEKKVKDNGTAILLRTVEDILALIPLKMNLRQDVLSDLQNVDKVQGVKWKRYPSLSNILKGHRRGEFTVLTGPTGCGKTTFMSEYSLDLAMQGVNTLWGSFEIRNSRLVKTMLQQMAGVPLEANLDKFESYADAFEKFPIYFMTFHGQQNLKVVMDAVEHTTYVHDIAHVIIDNVQFMMGTSDTSKHIDRFWKQDNVISRFRTFATKYNCHVTLIIHPRKEREEEDLSISSIFGGAKASQEADNILIIQDKRLTSVRGKKYLQVAKNRYSGDIGIVPLDFDKASLSYAQKRKAKSTVAKPDAKATMIFKDFLCVIFVISITSLVICNESVKTPTVLISILIRNKAHTLPYFLTLLQRLEYPKERIHLWICSDNNVDNSIEILNAWLEVEEKYYHGVYLKLDEKSSGFDDEDGVADWSPQRFTHVIGLREEALNYGRLIWADFLWMLDADVFLINPNTLSELISKQQTVVAPLLRSDGLYSNFWAGMTGNYYYLRTKEYEPILFRTEVGCFEVPMIHSAILIDLRKPISDRLTYDANNLPQYDGPIDDIIIFALSANRTGTALVICNDNTYGFVMIPMEIGGTLAEDKERLTNIKTEILDQDELPPILKNLQKFASYPMEDTLELSKIYMINLLRRPERRNRMHRLLQELRIHVETVDAVDGRMLNDSLLNEWGIKIMLEYADPYRGRTMTTGEIGCFLSHYIVWDKVIKEGQKRVMILEDDVHFEPFFRQKVRYILGELESLQIDWDLVYLGRKRLTENAEPWIPGSKYLVRAEYSYWTLGYILSLEGAKKLVEAMPLKNLVPVDEYIPILSNVHPREDWKARYPRRELTVLSTAPLLIHPTHYTGDQGYISDTENSKITTDRQNMNNLQTREEL